MNTKIIIATMAAITAVLFVMPANADLVAGGSSRLFVAYINDPTSDINCHNGGLELHSGANLSGTSSYVEKSSNLVSTNFDNKAQSLRINLTAKGAMSSTWAICMDDDYQSCWKLEQSDYSCDADYCTINDLGSFLNGRAKNNISSVVMLSCPAAVERAEPRILCTEDGQCSKYVQEIGCSEDPFFPEKCAISPIGSNSIAIIKPHGCAEKPDEDCFERYIEP